MSLTPEQLGQLTADFAALHDGSLDDDRRAQLEQQIIEDRDIRRLYIRYTRICAGLAWDLGEVPEGMSGQLAEVAELSAISDQEAGNQVEGSKSQRVEESETHPAPLTPHPSKTLMRWASRHPKWPSIAVALLVMVVGLGWAASIYMPERVAEKGGEKSKDEQSKPADEQDHVAKLSDWKDAVWLDGTRPPKRLPQLKIGKRLVIESGLIEVTYLTGVRVVIEGPAEFWVGGQASSDQEVRHQKDSSRRRKPMDREDVANSGFLEHGKLVARVEGKEAQGFAVDTPHARVEDLGTEFGINVQRGGAADVFVLTGEVDLVQEDPSGTARIRLVRDQGAFVADDGAITRREKVDTQLVEEMRARLKRLESWESGPTRPAPQAFREVAIVNHSFEHDVVPDGRSGREKPEEDNRPEWRTPFGWAWTAGVPAFGGVANPSTAKAKYGTLPYSGTDGNGRNGTMDGSQVAYFGAGVLASGGLEQTLEERFTINASYELRISAGTRRNSRAKLAGKIALFAGDHQIAMLSLPPDDADRFRDYVLSYDYDPAHETLAGLPLKVQLLQRERVGRADYDNVRLYVRAEKGDVNTRGTPE